MLFRSRPTRTTKLEFPPEFDLSLYRKLYSDLAHLDDTDLKNHYERFGSREGRRANALNGRSDFINLIPASAKTLEIGPFCAPLLRGPTISYFDVLDKEQLIERARKIGLEHSKTPDIDYVSGSGDLRIVTEKFDFVVSSHAVEHQPNLIRHLIDVEYLLNPGGFYFLVIPDKYYCFDHFIPESTLAGVIDAYFQDNKVHALRSVIEHGALTTHNDPQRHWRGDHGDITPSMRERLKAAIELYQTAEGAYIDVHAWYFFPASFRRLLTALNETSYITLNIERVYNTLWGHFEFFAILRKPV
jgi:SAM-dependent methyltransferase